MLEEDEYQKNDEVLDIKNWRRKTNYKLGLGKQLKHTVDTHFEIF